MIYSEKPRYHSTEHRAAILDKQNAVYPGFKAEFYKLHINAFAPIPTEIENFYTKVGELELQYLNGVAA